MRRIAVLLIVVGALLALPLAAPAARGGLTPAQLNSHGWTCFDVAGLGVHCAPPGQPWAPTGQPHVQLLYFFYTDDVNSTTAQLTGTESLIRADLYHGQPCPTEGGTYTDLSGFGLDYYGCHRITP